jgi:hypothetical protein
VELPDITKDKRLKNANSYLEMKYNLLLSYCSYISFYLMLRLEGKSSEHPVI